MMDRMHELNNMVFVIMFCIVLLTTLTLFNTLFRK